MKKLVNTPHTDSPAAYGDQLSQAQTRELGSVVSGLGVNPTGRAELSPDHRDQGKYHPRLSLQTSSGRPCLLSPDLPGPEN